MAVPSFPQPPPRGNDPRGFAVGIQSAHDLEAQGLRLVQFRWRYGPESDRENPFPPHQALDGVFTTLDGIASGWYVGDHMGCACGVSPVYRRDGRFTENPLVEE